MIRSKHQVLYMLGKGYTLAKQFLVAKTPPHNVETVYCTVPGERVVKSDLALDLIASGKVIPVANGLFGPETTQQWELKP